MDGVSLRPWNEVVDAYEAAGRDGADPEVRRIREAADEFGGILYGMLMKQMRATVEKSGFLDGGRTEEVFQDFVDTEYSREAGRRAGGDVALRLFEHALDAYEASVRSGRPAAVPHLPTSPISF